MFFGNLTAQLLETKLFQKRMDPHSTPLASQLVFRQVWVYGKFLHTPSLATSFLTSLGAWKIPSQGVWGRSRDFRNVSN